MSVTRETLRPSVPERIALLLLWTLSVQAFVAFGGGAAGWWGSRYCSSRVFRCHEVPQILALVLTPVAFCLLIVMTRAMWMGMRHRTVLDRNGISVLRGRFLAAALPWSGVEAVTVPPRRAGLERPLYVRTADGRRVRLHGVLGQVADHRLLGLRTAKSHHRRLEHWAGRELPFRVEP